MGFNHGPSDPCRASSLQDSRTAAPAFLNEPYLFTVHCLFFISFFKIQVFGSAKLQASIAGGLGCCGRSSPAVPHSSVSKCYLALRSAQNSLRHSSPAAGFRAKVVAGWLAGWLVGSLADVPPTNLNLSPCPPTTSATAIAVAKPRAFSHGIRRWERRRKPTRVEQSRCPSLSPAASTPIQSIHGSLACLRACLRRDVKRSEAKGTGTYLHSRYIVLYPGTVGLVAQRPTFWVSKQQ